MTPPLASIKLNVNRSRINALSLILALYLFAIGLFLAVASRHEMPAVWLFSTSFVPIVAGFSLALLALLVFLVSQRLDADGESEPWSFAAGELLIYLVMAQTLSGCLQNFVMAVTQVPRMVPEALAGDPALMAELRSLTEGLYVWLLVLCGGTWFLVVYAAPALFLFRFPREWRRKWVLAVSYVVLLATIAWITAYPYQIRARAAGQSASRAGVFLAQFAQPFLWRAAVPTLEYESEAFDGPENRR